MNMHRPRDGNPAGGRAGRGLGVNKRDGVGGRGRAARPGGFLRGSERGGGRETGGARCRLGAVVPGRCREPPRRPWRTTSPRDLPGPPRRAARRGPRTPGSAQRSTNSKRDGKRQHGPALKHQQSSNGDRITAAPGNADEPQQRDDLGQPEAAGRARGPRLRQGQKQPH
ncbi:unnamed protein product [Rangifer tarandus platyrhynchus]|uniref:Uncharacterized protein n=1 Tax=Rangifer tarandus platyrhynchus TaxID=3082113 RepID=A0AC59Z3V3_RANTA